MIESFIAGLILGVLLGMALVLVLYVRLHRRTVRRFAEAQRLVRAGEDLRALGVIEVALRELS